MKIQEFKLLPLFTIFGLFLGFFLFFPSVLSAHPGRTASDGCHYCRTNCDSWGEVWNARHCHNGGRIKPIISTQKPRYTVIPTPRPTVRPTIRPTIKSTPLSEVQGTITESTPESAPTPTTKPLMSGETITGLGALAVVVGLPVWIIAKIVKKFRN